MTTKRQKCAVKFCEEWLDVVFKGDINDFKSVSNFLSIYLDDAKRISDELYCEWSSYEWDLTCD